MTWDEDGGFSAVVICYCQDGVIFCYVSMARSAQRELNQVCG
jgi:hypothetical protein